MKKKINILLSSNEIKKNSIQTYKLLMDFDNMHEIDILFIERAFGDLVKNFEANEYKSGYIFAPERYKHIKDTRDLFRKIIKKNISRNQKFDFP